jgi:hypothetical protein
LRQTAAPGVEKAELTRSAEACFTALFPAAAAGFKKDVVHIVVRLTVVELSPQYTRIKPVLSTLPIGALTGKP